MCVPPIAFSPAAQARIDKLKRELDLWMDGLSASTRREVARNERIAELEAGLQRIADYQHSAMDTGSPVENMKAMARSLLATTDSGEG